MYIKCFFIKKKGFQILQMIDSHCQIQFKFVVVFLLQTEDIFSILLDNLKPMTSKQSNQLTRICLFKQKMGVKWLISSRSHQFIPPIWNLWNNPFMACAIHVTLQHRRLKCRVLACYLSRPWKKASHHEQQNSTFLVKNSFFHENFCSSTLDRRDSFHFYCGKNYPIWSVKVVVLFNSIFSHTSLLNAFL